MRYMVIFLLMLMLPRAVLAQCVLLDGPVQDCSGIYGGEGGVIDVQLNEARQVILRSNGLPDSNGGIAGSGGLVRAEVGLLRFGASAVIEVNGGASSGVQTGGSGGAIHLTIEAGSSVDDITLKANGGAGLRSGAGGDGGRITAVFDGVRVGTLTASAAGETGGVIDVMLGSRSRITTLTADGSSITLTLAEGALVETLNAANGTDSDTITIHGGGTVGNILTDDGDTVEIMRPD